MRRLTLLFIIAFIALCGCTNYKSVNIESVNLSSFRMENSTKANISFKVKVDNPLHTSVSVSTLEGVLRKDYERFATFSLDTAVTIGPMMNDEVIMTLNVSLCDPMSLLSMGLNIRSWKADVFTVEGKAVLRNGSGGKRTFKIKDIPLTKLIKIIKTK